MEQFWNFMQTIVIAGTVFWGIFIILLALPQSKLRKLFLKIYSLTAYALTGLITLYILNPVDLLPDIIPVLGQVDDAAGVVTAIFTGVAGIIANNRSNEPLETFSSQKKINAK